MKKVIRSIGVLIGCGAMFFMACNKDEKIKLAEEESVKIRAADDTFEEAFITKNDEFAAMFNQIRAENTEEIIVFANEPISVTTKAGVILELPANALEFSNGELVEGEVTILFNGLMDAGQMVIQDRGTSGITEDGEGLSALITGGEFFIEVRQGGEPLVLNKPMAVKVPTEEPDAEMQMFVQAENTGDDLVWELDEKREIQIEERKDEEGGGGYYYGYEILPDLGNQWGPCNIDKFNNGCTGALSDVSVKVPSGNDPTNTEVYMIPCGGTNQISNFDNWDASTNSFEEHGGRICEGSCVHFVLVTNVGGSLEYAIHNSVIINPGVHIENFSGPFTPIGAGALAVMINSLP